MAGETMSGARAEPLTKSVPRIRSTRRRFGIDAAAGGATGGDRKV